MQYSGSTQIGNIIISESNSLLTGLSINSLQTDSEDFSCSMSADNVFRQINEYLTGKRKEFNLNYSLNGTEFECLVWKELTKIKYGETISYKELAARISRPKAIRAAASACGKNPLPIIIPCHRVICSDGSIGGFKYGAALKNKLLELEYTYK